MNRKHLVRSSRFALATTILAGNGVRRIVMFTAALLCAALPASAGKFRLAPSHPVPDLFIVVLNEGVARHPLRAPADLPDAAQVAKALGKAHGGQIEEVWEHAIRGFVIRMPEARARKLANDPRVKSVEQGTSLLSAPVTHCYDTTEVYGQFWRDTRPLPTGSPQTITCADPDPANDTSGTGPDPDCKDNWGLDRIGQITGRDGSYAYANTGSGVHVYVMDTGVLWTHREFENRVSGGVDASVNPPVAGTAANTTDCLGHGTHVAGILAGKTFGVAKNASIHPVYIFGCGRPNDGTNQQKFIRALDWIVQDVTKGTPSTLDDVRPAIVNWSGGNDNATTIDTGVQTAVQGVINANITLVQAAGNQAGAHSSTATLQDACDISMGRYVPDAIIAGGTDAHDGRWVRGTTAPDTDWCSDGDCGSNIGSCVDIWSPARFVMSSSQYDDPNVAGRDNDETCQLSGTSMAAPHVAGAAAIYLQSNPSATPAQVARALRSRGIWGQLDDSAANPTYIGRDSDNVLVWADTRSTGDTAPEAAFTVSCPGRQCVFTSTSTDDGTITTTEWRFSDNTTATGTTVTKTFAANSTNSVVMMVRDNTSKTDHLRQTAISVNADAPPVASFTYTCTGTSCTFTSTSTDDGTISTLGWDFGDSTNGSGSPVTHSYASTGTYTVTLTATDSVGQTGTSSQEIVLNLGAPTGAAATWNGTAVTITWTAASGAESHDLYRKDSASAWAFVKNVTGATTNTTTDVPLTSANGVVLYRVVARSGSVSSDPSNHDSAYVGTFTNDPINDPVTAQPADVKAEHVTEMRNVVNGLRTLAGQAHLYSADEVDPANLRSTIVDDTQWTTLMTNLNSARAGVGLPAVGWTDTTPAVDVVIDESHIVSLRAGAK